MRIASQPAAAASAPAASGTLLLLLALPGWFCRAQGIGPTGLRFRHTLICASLSLLMSVWAPKLPPL